MIKDRILRLVFIPLLGISLPLVSGIITYRLYSGPELAGAFIFFFLTSLSIWAGCNWIHSRLRPLFRPLANPFQKVGAVAMVSAIYGGSVGGFSALLWLNISRERFAWNGLFRFVAACVAAVIIFTLIYEILFLSKEREIDNKIVDQLDRERTQAELQALSNEMDPHFLFNSLNTLNYLITNQPQQARLFNNKLAQVYKYFLVNKNKELITLDEELEFIENYFFLLQIRHDSKLELHTQLLYNTQATLVPPCSLQILIENAIKHNEFSEAKPLIIQVTLTENFLQVTNNIKPKPYAVNSTGVGLRNLRSRYRILFHREIAIESNRDMFVVQLPLITKSAVTEEGTAQT